MGGKQDFPTAFSSSIRDDTPFMDKRPAALRPKNDLVARFDALHLLQQKSP
jgi:hypothetical protein